MDGMTKRVHLKIFASDHRSFERVIVNAPKGCLWNADGEQQVVTSTLAQLRAQLPAIPFVAVRVGKGRFNIVHQAGRA